MIASVAIAAAQIVPAVAYEAKVEIAVGVPRPAAQHVPRIFYIPIRERSVYSDITLLRFNNMTTVK